MGLLENVNFSGRNPFRGHLRKLDFRRKSRLFLAEVLENRPAGKM